tara:strand:- start:9293 stop:9559 length:267 start_codon:yes stop_codon:yes gene_type:complete
LTDKQKDKTTGGDRLPVLDVLILAKERTMKTESTTSLAAITILATALALATLCGCNTTKSKTIIETKVPDVWNETPVQSLSLRMELTR